MRFEDEPVPGYPLPILPGHTSPGRLERVLRAGAFAVTTELDPPDSADPEDVYRRACIFDGCVDAINATDGSGANCHMSSLAVCALRLRARDADFLPRPQSHRAPGRGVAGIHVIAYRQEEAVAKVIAGSGVLDGRMPWHPGRDADGQPQRAAS